MASVFYEQKDYLNSVKYFKQTISLNPTSELASLGLFHSLVKVEKIDEAFEEFKRFSESYSIKLYQITIAELKNNLDFIIISKRKFYNTFLKVQIQFQIIELFYLIEKEK